MINIQLTVPPWQREHQCPVGKSVTAPGPGERTSWIFNNVCLLWSTRNDLKVACRQKSKQPWFFLFCQLLPGRLKRRKMKKIDSWLQVIGAEWMWPGLQGLLSLSTPRKLQPQEQQKPQTLNSHLPEVWQNLTKLNPKSALTSVFLDFSVFS